MFLKYTVHIACDSRYNLGCFCFRVVVQGDSVCFAILSPKIRFYLSLKAILWFVPSQTIVIAIAWPSQSDSNLCRFLVELTPKVISVHELCKKGLGSCSESRGVFSHLFWKCMSEINSFTWIMALYKMVSSKSSLASGIIQEQSNSLFAKNHRPTFTMLSIKKYLPHSNLPMHVMQMPA